MSNVSNKAKLLLAPKKNTNFFYSFFPESIKNYFDDSQGIDLDKKIKQSNSVQYLLTGSIETTDIDQYRQGVEITNIKHFFAGINPKIHAGEPGHVLRKNFYGADKNYFKENYYEDLDYFNPIEYIYNSQAATYPIITHDTDETENYNLNGVIEPFTIRSIASFYSIYYPFEAHSVKGMMMDGNHEISTMSTSMIVTVHEKNTKQKFPGWFDMIDLIGTVKKIPTIPFFNDKKANLDPFNDSKNKVELSSKLPNDMLDAVLKLIGSTENYVRDYEISAPSGWTYDDVTIKGTDSLAFGGMGY